MEQHSYEVELDWIRDRVGVLRSSILDTTIQVATPPEFAKGVARIWSPEHLFVSAVSSCFMTTFLAVAENSKMRFSGFSCSATGFLEGEHGKWSMTKIILRPELKILDAADIKTAMKVLKIAENSCLISNSIRSTVTVLPKVSVA